MCLVGHLTIIPNHRCYLIPGDILEQINEDILMY